MARAKKPQSLNKAFAEEKELAKKAAKSLEANRRKRMYHKVKRLVADEKVDLRPGANPDWAKLTIAHKLELVMSWSINGGCLFGQRYSRYKLGVELGLSDSEVEDLIEKCEKDFLKVYEENGALPKVLAKTITRLSYQLTEDRGRMVTQCDIIERERLACLKEIEEAKGMPVAKPAQRRERYLKISRFYQLYVDLTNQQYLASSTLNEHTKSSIKFIEIFNKKHGPGEGGGEEPKEKDKILTSDAAYRIVEENSAQILPSQDAIEVRKGSRDPDEAFKGLSKANE